MNPWGKVGWHRDCKGMFKERTELSHDLALTSELRISPCVLALASISTSSQISIASNTNTNVQSLLAFLSPWISHHASPS